MDNELKKSLEWYLCRVNEICQNLINGLSLNNKEELLIYKGRHRIFEHDINGMRYVYHGRGCCAFNEKIWIDWDFGYRSNWCGIDPFKVANTLERNKMKSVNDYDGNRIKAECEKAVSDGTMFLKYERYYFNIPISDTFVPCFPKDFDTLIIEHFGSSWSVPRNKVIDRFIRKSIWVSNQIEQRANIYTLRFMLEGNEVYSIPYEDTCYQESAVRIMSDDIIQNAKRNELRENGMS